VNKGILFAFTTAVISGFSIFFSKIFVSQMDPLVYTVSKNVLVALILSFLIFKPKFINILKNFSRSDWVKLVMIGIIGGSIPFFLFFTGLTLTSASNAALIHKTLFVWVALLAVPLLKERLRSLQIAGYFLIFFGSVLIASWQALNFSKGEALILSATILWAIENVVAKIVLKKISSEVVVWARMFFGSIVLLLILFFQGKISLLFTPSHPQLVSVCVGGLFLLGYVLTWYKALKYAPATVVSSILVVSVVITNFLSSIFITNAFSKAQVLSSVIIVVGAFFVKLKPVYELSRPYNLH